MMSRTMLLAALLLSAGLGPCARAEAPASNTAAAATRDLWLADEGRYVRRWLVLGPMQNAQADEVAKPGGPATLTAPANGLEQVFSNGAPVRWRGIAAFGDVLDAFSATGMRDGEVGLALASVDWPTAGEARLLMGGNVRGVWVNGKWVDGAGSQGSAPALAIDGRELPVQLAAGSNLILLRLERVDRPPLLTLRVVRPGFVDTAPSALSPYVESDNDNTLRVMPGARNAQPSPQVVYEVIAPGGRKVSGANHPRNLGATFDASGWDEGPYEIRVTTQNERGVDTVFHLPWYKGDTAGMQQRLLDAIAVARTSIREPASPTDGHLAMLADMVRDRADGGWRALHSPSMEYLELIQQRVGQPGGQRPGGFVRLAWIDDIDGSTQFCRAYLPVSWTGKAPVPALVFLHGYNPANPPYVRWWSIAERHNGVADRHGVIVLEPMGRGNVDYRWMGERDVLRCLAEAKQRFSIDADRVYLTGESMGGNGTWLIASRHPQLFAAAAPVYGGWDYRTSTSGYAFTQPLATRPMERFIQEAHASFAGAEGLRNVPLYVLHGDEDAAVPVEQSRHGVRLLQRWGYDVRYREIPGIGHEDLKARDEIAAWLLTHRRDPAPRDVRLRAYDLAGASAHWLQVTAWQSPLELMEARARVIDRSLVRIDTKNVAALTLTPPGEFFESGKPLRVVWNGAEQEVPARDGVFRLATPGYQARSGDKHRDREGRLTYFFNTPFAIVIGTTSKDPALAGGLAQKGATLAELWERWQHVKPRILLDTQVTPEIERKYSLLLLGGPGANQVSTRLAGKLPLKVGGNSVTLDGRKFAASDAVAQMLYPHPENPERYLLQVAPTSAAGLRYWNPQQFWHALNGFPMNLWDWTIVDGRRLPLASGLFPDRGWVAAGLFDMHWRRDDRFTVLGDEKERAIAPLRRAPPAGFKLPPAELDTLAGLYRINPGQIGGGGLITVAREGDGITATAPEGGRAWPLEAESGTDFAVVGLGTPVSFLRDGAGNVTGMTYHYNGQEIVASRLPPGSVPRS